MRQGPHSKRGRGRGGNRRPNVPNRNQTFDSNGPDVRIRGNAHQVYDKYLTLARDATTAGDRVLAESLYQHADHYFRIYSAFNEENEARRNAQQQENAPQPEMQARDDGDAASGETAAAEASESAGAQPAEEAPARKTRSERRQDAEAAEQAEQQARPPRQPRRRRSNGTAEEATPAADNDSALRAMLGASDSGIPVAGPATNEEKPATEEVEAKPVRRRGRPRKIAEPVAESTPSAGED